MIDIASGEVKKKLLLDQKQWGYNATAGGLVFGADSLGDIYAYDALTLDQLWVFNVGTGIKAPAMSFAVNGKQYVAVLAGSRQSVNIINNAPELKHTSTASMLFVFSL